MNPKRLLRLLPALSLLGLNSCTTSTDEQRARPSAPDSAAIERAQVPTWSRADLDFFLHGSMSTEFVPVKVLKAFEQTYADLFPKPDLSNFGLIPDPDNWPIGFSRNAVPHFGGLPSVGINCAACHVGEVIPPSGGRPVRVLGMTSNFDVEGFLGAVIVSTFRTADPANMKRFLKRYLYATNYDFSDTANTFDSEWERQEQKIIEVISSDPSGSKDVAPGALHDIKRGDLGFSFVKLVDKQVDLAALSLSMLKLFHNLRAALHVPDEPPPASPPNGPGRNDPWRLLSYSLLGLVTEPAPVKFGIVWNEDQRTWVHYDGNTRSPIVRNLAASLGLGAPLLGHRGVLDFAAVQRHTTLSQVIRPPRYPWPIDRAASGRGAQTYNARCASCHDGPETDTRLHPIAEIQTDPNRATIFTPQVAELFNKFFAELQIAGYEPPQPPPLRGTLQYWSPSLAGVWARAPYLHNGSVRTMQELLTPPGGRAKTIHRGSRVYDALQMGYADEGAYLLDTKGAGNSHSGHDYGTDLSAGQKRDLVEYLKTL